jgi:TrmH family RNA methyltransferase
MGAIFKLDITVVDDMEKTALECIGLGRRVFAAELRDNAVSLLDADVKKSDVFIIGNEGHGVRESVRTSCTGSVIVPMCEGPESLNAAICASLLSWEVYRSRR